jgi:hypothetical protein
LGLIPYSGDDAHTFASALLSFGGTMASSQPVASFDLPRFRLTVASDAGNYLATCRRALVDDPQFAPDREIHLSVLDYETHPEMPRGIWTGATFGPRPLANGLEPTGINASLNTDERLLQFFDPLTGTGIEALARPGQFPPWIESFPVRNFLHWAYQAIGWRIVHAGALAVGGRGVMLVGAGGTGKSGAVLSGIIAGLDSAGDDYLALEITDAAVRAYPVARMMKQDAAGLRRLGLDPAARSLGPPNWQGKHEFDFEDIGAGRRARNIDLMAILLPRIANSRRTIVRPASAREAMMAFAPNNLHQLPDGWRQGLSFTATVARRLPAYHLDLGEDPSEIAGVMADFIAGRRS